MHKTNTSFSVGPVELNVKNLILMKEFYLTAMGLDIVKEDAESVTLGKNHIPLLVLHEHKELRSPQPDEAGLYHFAILFSSRGELAQTVHRILKITPHFFAGSSDHSVSEAFYFTDPEGNGIELYFDRDRSTWQWENNRIKMTTQYIDPLEYVQRYLVLEEKETKTSIGHIHLKVGNISEAKKFYADILGFTITAELSQALFVSFGGYHHHIGLNEWESFGAGIRTESLGLKTIQCVFANNEEFNIFKKRLIEKNIPYNDHKTSFTFHDPWKNQFTVTQKKR